MERLARLLTSTRSHVWLGSKLIGVITLAATLAEFGQSSEVATVSFAPLDISARLVSWTIVEPARVTSRSDATCAAAGHHLDATTAIDA